MSKICPRITYGTNICTWNFLYSNQRASKAKAPKVYPNICWNNSCRRGTWLASVHAGISGIHTRVWGTILCSATKILHSS